MKWFIYETMEVKMLALDAETRHLEMKWLTKRE